MMQAGKNKPMAWGVFSLILIASVPARHTRAGVWNHKKCAVALTYDDGLNVHLDNVIPVLDSAGFKGTFYLTGYREGVGQRINDWRAAADNGHELGNHTLFHPCAAVTEGRDYSDWVIPEYDMNHYTIRRMVDEIKMANVFLKAIDGKEKRTIAYPCGDWSIHDSSYVPFIKSEFAGGRGGAASTDIHRMDPYQIAAVGVDDGYSSGQLIDMVIKAKETDALLVFCFHGVGGGHRTNIALRKHNDLVRFLKQNKSDVWVAPLVDIAEYLKNR